MNQSGLKDDLIVKSSQNPRQLKFLSKISEPFSARLGPRGIPSPGKMIRCSSVISLMVSLTQHSSCSSVFMPGLMTLLPQLTKPGNTWMPRNRPRSVPFPRNRMLDLQPQRNRHLIGSNPSLMDSKRCYR